MGTAPEVGTVGDDAVNCDVGRVCTFESPEFDFLAVMVDVVQEGFGEAHVVHVERTDIVVLLVAEVGEVSAVHDDWKSGKFEEKEFFETY